jgi:para-aminobenzoate synthetase/4-amino-4-deoxychorismate lyase
VLETILVLDGRVVLPDEHLGRLRASVAALYGERLPPALALDVPGSGAWRLRVVARPGGDVAVERAQVDATALFPAGPLDLQPLVLPGGLGEHKWADRELVSSVPEPLILDIDGEPLETGSGNLFAVEGDRLVTPAADGRILPGVTRAAVLALAPALGLRVAVGPVRPVVADELFVTSAIRGVRPVGRCEGIGAWRAGPWTRALAEALRARWRASADQRPGAPARG